MLDMSFEGQVVLVTGAASGLGRAAAELFSRAGASLCLVDVNEEGLASLRVALPGAAICRVLDISCKANCDAAVAAAVEHFGRLDVLCNVAGILHFSHCRDVSQAQWERVMGVNLNGPFFLSQAAIPHLLESGGNIVNVASSAAFVGEAYLVSYSTSKAALVHMTKAMAMEYMHTAIRINAVAPGGMHTAMAASAAGIPPDVRPELIQRYTGLRPPCEPEEVARLILYVASRQAGAIHGACLSIDGGITAG